MLAMSCLANNPSSPLLTLLRRFHLLSEKPENYLMAKFKIFYIKIKSFAHLNRKWFAVNADVFGNKAIHIF